MKTDTIGHFNTKFVNTLMCAFSTRVLLYEQDTRTIILWNIDSKKSDGSLIMPKFETGPVSFWTPPYIVRIEWYNDWNIIITWRIVNPHGDSRYIYMKLSIYFEKEIKIEIKCIDSHPEHKKDGKIKPICIETVFIDNDDCSAKREPFTGTNILNKKTGKITNYRLDFVELQIPIKFNDQPLLLEMKENFYRLLPVIDGIIGAAIAEIELDRFEKPHISALRDGRIVFAMSGPITQVYKNDHRCREKYLIVWDWRSKKEHEIITLPNTDVDCYIFSVQEIPTLERESECIGAAMNSFMDICTDLVNLVQNYLCVKPSMVKFWGDITQ